jgi:hypothetical protein
LSAVPLQFLAGLGAPGSKLNQFGLQALVPFSLTRRDTGQTIRLCGELEV